MKSAHIIRCTSDPSFINECVAHIEDEILKSITQGKTFVLGVSGGSTPKPIYHALANSTRINWSNVEVFLIDERYVAPDHTESNQRMIRDALITPAGIQKEHYHVPNTLMSLPGCIEDYKERVLRLFQRQVPQLLLLGMGEDGHIASLFPGDKSALHERSQTILHTTTEMFAVRDRLTVSLPIIRSADKRIVMMKGEKKRALLERMIVSPDNQLLWPAQEFLNEGTTWIVAA